MTGSFRRWTAVFSITQLGGLAAMWLWPHARGAAAFLWGTAFIALFPGNMISTILIEKPFWNSSLSLADMVTIEVPIMVAINALLWFLIIGSIRKFIGRRLPGSSPRRAA